jgi:hypothetical protein
MTLEHMTFQELNDELADANRWLLRALGEVEEATKRGQMIGRIINERFPNA